LNKELNKVEMSMRVRAMSRRSMLRGTAAGAAFATMGVPLDAAVAVASDPLAAARYGAWGFDLAGMDRAVRPGVDFYRFANGAWLQATPIPEDRASVGMFYVLRELADARVRAIIERSAANPANEREALVGALFRSFMDERRLEALNDAPIRTRLAEIRALRTRGDLARLEGRAQYALGGPIFSFSVLPDDREPTRNVVYGGHNSLGLPDREYYLSESFAEHRTRYRAYVARLLGLAGWPQAEDAAARILAYETEIAAAHWPLADRRDAIKIYNPTSFAVLARSAPAYPWREFLEGAELDHWTGKVVVAEASAIAPIASIFARASLETLKDWAAFHFVNQAAPYLSTRFVEANFDFYLRFMQGQPQQRDRWRRAVGVVNNLLPHAVGQTYAEIYFTSASRAKMDELVANVVAAMGRRIQNLAWMSAETKVRALDKLAKFKANIGAPRIYRSFAGLTLDPADLFGNIERTQAFTWRWYLGKLNQPVNPAEWTDTPQTVNAYYRTTYNDITFPAGILQPPFFDPDADPAVNYGAIGGVIGHEICHGFDDQGRRSDGDGVLRDWWTPADGAQFEAQANRLAAQYDSFEPLPGARVNGRLTLGESVADLAGLTIALEAYRASLGGRAAPVLDGFTGEQRVFLGWAQAWRNKYRDELARQLIATDEHPPPSTRVNGVMRNMDAWYEAFSVREGDALYLPPGERVRIW
jgi:putative endopeptidase